MQKRTYSKPSVVKLGAVGEKTEGFYMKWIEVMGWRKDPPPPQ
jgi:hypothetical protein